MFTNDLNNAYLYESERRNDERRAAAESERSRELTGKHKIRKTSLIVLAGVLAGAVVILRSF
jgi:hypothetical protein